jgi:ElaA protein
MKSTKQSLRWNWYGFDDMGLSLLYDMLALREAIFVVEQKCVYQELDGRDKSALHLVVTSVGVVVACLRLLKPTKTDTRVKIGRVAVAPSFRGQGVARESLQMAIEEAQRQFPSSPLYLEAQSYLHEFYESLGFRACGPEFLEDGIPHIPMQYAG